jgi:8-oxo-dGTP diphosphatase
VKKLATMIYLIKDEKILFLKRDKVNDNVHKKGFYLPMGGKVELGEGIEDCARREVFEESGIKVNKLDLRGILYFIGFGQDKDDWIDYLFVSDKFEGEPINGNEGSFEWIDKKNVANLELYAGDRIFLPLVFGKKLTIMEFNYNQHEYLSSKIIKSL